MTDPPTIEDDLRRCSPETAHLFMRNMRFLAPYVFTMTMGMALLSLLFLLIMVRVADAPGWLVWVGPMSWLAVGVYAWPLLGLLWPLVRTGRRIWEFICGFLVSLPVATVAAVLMPDVALVSLQGVLLVLGSSGAMAAAAIGVFDAWSDEMGT